MREAPRDFNMNLIISRSTSTQVLPFEYCNDNGPLIPSLLELAQRDSITLSEDDEEENVS